MKYLTRLIYMLIRLPRLDYLATITTLYTNRVKADIEAIKIKLYHIKLFVFLLYIMALLMVYFYNT